MKGTGALQMIFAFFLGLVVVAFVGIGVATFYPQPEWTGVTEVQERWQLVTGITLLVIATALLAISLALPERQVVISNGILLGGVGTMLYAVGMTVASGNNLWRFVVVAVALVVTVVIGYLKFARPREGAPDPAVEAEAPAASRPAPAAAVPASSPSLRAPVEDAAAWAPSAPAGTAPAGTAPAAAGDLAARLSAVERKLDALARALRG